MQSRGDCEFERVALPSDHCDVLRDLLISERARLVIEIGLAYGISALAIGEALASQQGARHLVIRAYQDRLENAGWDSITEARLHQLPRPGRRRRPIDLRHGGRGTAPWRRFLKGFADNVSQPPDPGEEAVHYLPTQILTQYVRHVLHGSGEPVRGIR